MIPKQPSIAGAEPLPPLLQARAQRLEYRGKPAQVRPAAVVVAPPNNRRLTAGDRISNSGGRGRLVARRACFLAIALTISGIQRRRADPSDGLDFPTAGMTANPGQPGGFGVAVEDQIP
jgi:hypothetical protein